MPTGTLLRWIAVAGFMAAWTGCSTNIGNNKVVAIEKTETYHLEGCPPTHMAKTTIMTVDEARAKNLKPCPACKADSSRR